MFFTVSRTGLGWVEHAQCAALLGSSAVIVNYHSAIPGRRCALRVVFNVYTHRVSS